MESVGIRRLKSRLSEYVRRAKAGEAVSITSRGEVVAELRPPEHAREAGLPPDLVAMLRRGIARRIEPNDPTLYPKMSRVSRRRSAQELLDEERADR